MLSGDITITIVASNPGLTLAGFGILLGVAVNASWVERTRTYNNMTGVAADFADTTPEFQFADTVFGQSPAPPTIMFGRAANKPTQVFVASVSSVVSVAGTPYTVRINDLSTGNAGAGIGVFATFTTVGSDTNDSIVAGIVAAINALSVSGVSAAATGTSGSHVCTITCGSAGKWIGVEVFDTAVGSVGALMALLETTADPGITADLTAINTESAVWYGLAILFKSSVIIQAAAAFAESNQKLFIPATADTIVATVADGSATDIAHVLKGASRKRTAVFFHPRNDEFADAGEFGVFFPKNPGTENWRKKAVSGPTPASYTATQQTNLAAKFCNYYGALTAFGAANSVSVIFGNGQCANGGYIDFLRFCDWWSASVQTGLENLEIALDKVGMDDPGIAHVEKVIENVNTIGQNRNAIATTPAPTISAPLAIDIPTTDKQTRTLNGVLANFTYVSPMNKINVTAAIAP